MSADNLYCPRFVGPGAFSFILLLTRLNGRCILLLRGEEMKNLYVYENGTAGYDKCGAKYKFNYEPHGDSFEEMIASFSIQPFGQADIDFYSGYGDILEAVK